MATPPFFAPMLGMLELIGVRARSRLASTNGSCGSNSLLNPHPVKKACRLAEKIQNALGENHSAIG
jgi:hypothetical protein